MQITKENKEFLAEIGKDIHKYAKNFELPETYQFLKKLTPEQIGLFIAKTFVASEEEFAKNITQDKFGQGVLNNKYLAHCAKGFLEGLKSDGNWLTKKDSKIIDKILDIWSYNKSKSDFKARPASQSFGCNVEKEMLAKITKSKHYGNLALQKLKKAELNSCSETLIKDKEVRLPLIRDNLYLDDRHKESDKFILIGGGVYYDSRESKEGMLLNLVKRYEKSIENAKTDEDKIHACFTLASWIKNYQVFPDANSRLGINILNKTLKDNDLSPCLLKNQDRFFFEYPVINELNPEKALAMYYEGVERFEKFKQEQIRIEGKSPILVESTNVKSETQETISAFPDNMWATKVLKPSQSLKIIKKTSQFKDTESYESDDSGIEQIYL
jgi:hypothetical protein